MENVVEKLNAQLMAVHDQNLSSLVTILLRKILNREPGADDFKKCTLVHRVDLLENKCSISYDNVVVGNIYQTTERIESENGDTKYLWVWKFVPDNKYV